MKQGSKTKSFTGDHVVREDGSVAFTCSQDTELWPFAALDPHHPGEIQALSYWVSVECAIALGKWDPDKWSALTWTRWQCGERGVGKYASGIYRRTLIEGNESFTIDFFDAQDRLICVLDGRGVVFRTRDFEKWRSDAKDKVEKAPSESFGYAEPALHGVPEADRPFLAPLEGSAAHGLVDHANGMPPGHPWLSGSGDHVNSAHQAEIARQFACLVHGGKPTRVESAEMRFTHYVELGTPFDIELLPDSADDRLEMQMRQSGRDCTRITYRVG